MTLNIIFSVVFVCNYLYDIPIGQDMKFLELKSKEMVWLNDIQVNNMGMCIIDCIV